MSPEQTMHQLRLVEKRYEKVRVNTCDLNISNMAKDSADVIEDLMKKMEWVSVKERLPLKPDYDWVLVRTYLLDGEGKPTMEGVPHVAELRNGVWFCDCCDQPMEETLCLKVVSWFDMQLLK